MFAIAAMFEDGEGCLLSWTRRMKIIIGIARGLRYLHTELNPPFTISELNSSAVYLTEDFSPKVAFQFSILYCYLFTDYFHFVLGFKIFKLDDIC